MKDYNTSDWSSVTIGFDDGGTFMHKTLCSKEYFEQFCNEYGYTLIEFIKGSNPYCS